MLVSYAASIDSFYLVGSMLDRVFRRTPARIAHELKFPPRYNLTELPPEVISLIILFAVTPLRYQNVRMETLVDACRTLTALLSTSTVFLRFVDKAFWNTVVTLNPPRLQSAWCGPSPSHAPIRRAAS